ncbi:uncharacterized protein [Oscarella lobularis]
MHAERDGRNGYPIVLLNAPTMVIPCSAVGGSRKGTLLSITRYGHMHAERDGRSRVNAWVFRSSFAHCCTLCCARREFSRSSQQNRLSGVYPKPAASCKAIRMVKMVCPSGIYFIQPPGTPKPFHVYCDMEMDGGGWMLLYAYDHDPKQNNPVIVNLPTHPNGYSHQLLDNLQISREWANELLFYCQTNAHNRVMNFKTSHPGIIETAYDGRLHFSVSDWTQCFTPLKGHTAYLPKATNNIWATKSSTPGFTDFPFWKGGTYHWGISPDYKRFECDNFDGNTYSTLHRVWVRD